MFTDMKWNGSQAFQGRPLSLFFRYWQKLIQMDICYFRCIEDGAHCDQSRKLILLYHHKTTWRLDCISEFIAQITLLYFWGYNHILQLSHLYGSYASSFGEFVRLATNAMPAQLWSDHIFVDLQETLGWESQFFKILWYCFYVAIFIKVPSIFASRHSAFWGWYQYPLNIGMINKFDIESGQCLQPHPDIYSYFSIWSMGARAVSLGIWGDTSHSWCLAYQIQINLFSYFHWRDIYG